MTFKTLKRILLISRLSLGIAIAMPTVLAIADILHHRTTFPFALLGLLCLLWAVEIYDEERRKRIRKTLKNFDPEWPF